MSYANTSLQCLTVLTQDDGISGSKFEREPEDYTVEQLKRWLKCRGLKLGGKRWELVKRVADCKTCSFLTSSRICVYFVFL